MAWGASWWAGGVAWGGVAWWAGGVVWRGGVMGGGWRGCGVCVVWVRVVWWAGGVARGVAWCGVGWWVTRCSVPPPPPPGRSAAARCLDAARTIPWGADAHPRNHFGSRHQLCISLALGAGVVIAAMQAITALAVGDVVQASGVDYEVTEITVATHTRWGYDPARVGLRSSRTAWSSGWM